jgi:hypothetical protein
MPLAWLGAVEARPDRHAAKTYATAVAKARVLQMSDQFPELEYSTVTSLIESLEWRFESEFTTRRARGLLPLGLSRLLDELDEMAESE